MGMGGGSPPSRSMGGASEASQGPRPPAVRDSIAFCELTLRKVPSCPKGLVEVGVE